jgi:DNA helicase-2/ATP-dependent DNA helicase PcrA
MKPSEKQLEIFKTWEETDKNIVISAVAGSGKSTTLMELLKRSRKKTLMLAFNKSIQEDLEKKIVDLELKQGKALTLHSLGLSAIRKNHKKVYIEKNKAYSIFFEVLNKNKKWFKGMSTGDRSKLMFTIIDFDSISRIFLTDDLKEINFHALNMDKSTFTEFPYFVELWEYYLTVRERFNSANDLIIDFTDMIYLPVAKNYDLPIDPYYLFIDECQDLNLVQHKLIDKLINGPVKKWVAVGDPKQAIYGFSGSHTTSFDLFSEKENTVLLPLDINYRCSSSIIAKANEIFNNLIPFKSEYGVVANENKVENIKENSLIICRNSKPIFQLFIDLLSIGKNPSLVGEDILNKMLHFFSPYKDLHIETALDRLYAEMEILLNKKDSSDQSAIKYYVFRENLECGMILIKKFYSTEQTKNFKTSVFIDKLKAIFNVESDIKICTIHKSKGLEADTVYILNESLIPSKFAKSKQQLEQEQNLKYVARTRAKKEMFFLNLPY